MEAETSILLQEIMLEILLKHLERVCGIKTVKTSEQSEETQTVVTIRPEQSNCEEIVQLLRLLQEIMRISLDT